MKKYDWDISSLIEKRNSLEQQCSCNKDRLLIEQLETYRDLVRNYDIRLDDVDIDINCDEDTPMIPFFKEAILPSINPAQLDMVTGAIDVAKNYNIYLNPTDALPTRINNKELVEMTASLFKQIPNKRLYNDFLNIINNKEHNLLIKHFSKLPTIDYGLTFVDAIENKAFGLIARQNTINDVITLAHEATHMILRKNESPFFWKTSKRMYTEVEGSFINLLFNDLLIKNGYYIEEQFNIADLERIISYIKDVFVAIKVIEHSEDEITNIEELSSDLENYNITTPINEKNVSYFLIPDFKATLDSSSSYLIALDLYNLYKKDPERTIDILYSIPLFGGEHAYSELEKIGVTFFEDGYQNLDNHCKKLIKEKPVH